MLLLDVLLCLLNCLELVKSTIENDLCATDSRIYVGCLASGGYLDLLKIITFDVLDFETISGLFFLDKKIGLRL